MISDLCYADLFTYSRTYKITKRKTREHFKDFIYFILNYNFFRYKINLKHVQLNLKVVKESLEKIISFENIMKTLNIYFEFLLYYTDCIFFTFYRLAISCLHDIFSTLFLIYLRRWVGKACKMPMLDRTRD